jgi:hypothetical protein
MPLAIAELGAMSVIADYVNNLNAADRLWQIPLLTENVRQEHTRAVRKVPPFAPPVLGVQFAPRVILAHPIADLAKGVRR